jgi:hypothetical protein
MGVILRQLMLTVQCRLYVYEIDTFIYKLV